MKNNGMFSNFTDACKFLAEDLDWNLGEYPFEELTFEYNPVELGMKGADCAKIHSIHQLRPMSGSGQAWAVFFVDFETRRLPVASMREVLSALVVRKRAATNQAQRAVFPLGDLLFIACFGQVKERGSAFVRFQQKEEKASPAIQTLSWLKGDPLPRLKRIRKILTDHLAWPENPLDYVSWKKQWASTFDQEVETPEVRRQINDFHVRKHLKEVPKEKPLQQEELNALSLHIEETQRKLAEHLHSLGFIADCYLELGEKLGKGKERFDRIICESRMASRERYMKNLPKLRDELKQIHHENQELYLRILTSGSSLEREKLETEFRNKIPYIHSIYIRFFFTPQVIEGFCEKVIEYQNMMSDCVRKLLAAPEDKGLVAKLHEIRLITWKTPETLKETHGEILRCTREIAALKNVIICSCREHVSKIAKKFSNSGIELEDLIQEGNLGLVEAMERYDPGKDTDFFHYTFRWIENPMADSSG
jgi:hypothetical protein